MRETSVMRHTPSKDIKHDKDIVMWRKTGPPSV